MPRPLPFLLEFERTIEFVLSQVSGVSRRDFIRLYDYDDFLEGEASQCETPRQLAIAFATRFLGAVSPAYFRALSFALVRFLARQCGRSVDEADKAAVKALAEIDCHEAGQVEQWLDAYFRDVL